MLNRTARRVSCGFRAVSDAVRSVVAPTALVRSAQPETVPDPEGVFTPEEMPGVEEVEATAAAYNTACDAGRAADRGKREARKLLDRLPAGVYGRVTVERTPSSRTTADLDSIRATYERLGLGPVPMRTCAPSLRITEAAADVVAFPAPADAAPALAA
ncbi:hypothetical protein [Streptomyces heilongjiangensis]|uniref:Uncharacterized protein n=1 Tax=Streptomyces heilongjiangensis TaxID=945052 RepID=A0ABW1BHG0_9ACTN|nr:hypothetical protein [Streptomyces heilongjiangensis]MDC2951040.1 hypothetical protein [Streptomyces heilongjiangensis]